MEPTFVNRTELTAGKLAEGHRVVNRKTMTGYLVFSGVMFVVLCFLCVGLVLSNGAALAAKLTAAGLGVLTLTMACHAFLPTLLAGRATRRRFAEEQALGLPAGRLYTFNEEGFTMAHSQGRTTFYWHQCRALYQSPRMLVLGVGCQYFFLDKCGFEVGDADSFAAFAAPRLAPGGARPQGV